MILSNPRKAGGEFCGFLPRLQGDKTSAGNTPYTGPIQGEKYFPYRGSIQGVKDSPKPGSRVYRRGNIEMRWERIGEALRKGKTEVGLPRPFKNKPHLTADAFVREGLCTRQAAVLEDECLSNRIDGGC